MEHNTYSKFNRLREIYLHITKKKYSTSNELKSSLKDKFGIVSDRTLSRDIESLRKELNLNIEYVRPHGYTIADDSIQDTSKIESLLHLTNSVFFKLKFSNDNDFIIPDIVENANGNEFLEDVFYAISKSFALKITYKKFESLLEENRIIIPLLLKEYRQRWYIYSLEGDEFKTYSLDRVVSIQVLTSQKLAKPKFDKNIFNKVLGVSLVDYKVEKIKLLFTKSEANYIKSIPIHTSQKVLRENENSVLIELKIVVNWEIEERIRGFGETVEVIEPIYLRDKLANEFRALAKKYTT